MFFGYKCSSPVQSPCIFLCVVVFKLFVSKDTKGHFGVFFFLGHIFIHVYIKRLLCDLTCLISWVLLFITSSEKALLTAPFCSIWTWHDICCIYRSTSIALLDTLSQSNKWSDCLWLWSRAISQISLRMDVCFPSASLTCLASCKSISQPLLTDDALQGRPVDIKFLLLCKCTKKLMFLRGIGHIQTTDREN